MTYEGIEYVIRVGIGRNEWALLIQRDLRLGPTAGSRPVGRDGCFEIIHSGNVLHDAVALVVPDIDTERKVRLGDHAAQRSRR